MNLKKLKQQLQSSFDLLKQRVEGGELPSIEEVKNFSKLASRMVNYAEEKWQFEAEDFAHLANQLISAVKTQDLQEVYTLINTLEDSKNYCHRSFKS